MISAPRTRCGCADRLRLGPGVLLLCADEQFNVSRLFCLAGQRASYRHRSSSSLLTPSISHRTRSSFCSLRFRVFDPSFACSFASVVPYTPLHRKLLLSPCPCPPPPGRCLPTPTSDSWSRCLLIPTSFYSHPPCQYMRASPTISHVTRPPNQKQQTPINSQHARG